MRTKQCIHPFVAWSLCLAFFLLVITQHSSAWLGNIIDGTYELEVYHNGKKQERHRYIRLEITPSGSRAITLTAYSTGTPSQVIVQLHIMLSPYGHDVLTIDSNPLVANYNYHFLHHLVWLTCLTAPGNNSASPHPACNRSYTQIALKRHLGRVLHYQVTGNFTDKGFKPPRQCIRYTRNGAAGSAFILYNASNQLESVSQGYRGRRYSLTRCNTRPRSASAPAVFRLSSSDDSDNSFESPHSSPGHRSVTQSPQPLAESLDLPQENNKQPNTLTYSLFLDKDIKFTATGFGLLLLLDFLCSTCA